MTTEHTAAAVAEYRRIEDTIFSLLAMLEQENVQCARQPDVTALEHVAAKLEQVEDAWTQARQIADADRALADEQDERETRALDVAVQ